MEIYLLYLGSLFCGSCPWGWLQLNPNKTLNEQSLYTFLKTHTGIILKDNCLYLTSEMDVSNNFAKFSQLDIALENIAKNPESWIDYQYTITEGMEFLNEQKIKDFGAALLQKFKNSGKNLEPSQENPITQFEDRALLVALAKYYTYSNGEKAHGIKEFSGTNTSKNLFVNFKV